MILEPSRFLNEIKKRGDFPALILLVGNEEFLIEDSLKDLRRLFKEMYRGGLSDFNSEDLYGDRDGSARIMDACGTLPLDSPKRLVVLRRLEKCPSATRDELENYALSPNPSTCLAVLWNAKPDHGALTGGFATQAGRNGILVKFWRLGNEDARSAWIRQRAAEEGKEISREACELLSREGGESLRELKSEIEKCVLFAWGGKRIEAGDVKEVMSFRRNRMAWDFTDDLEKRNFRRAGRVLELCLRQGEDPVRMINLFARSARRMCGKSSSRAKKRLFKGIEESDLSLKSGHGPESCALERLLIYAAAS
jgi:DNA polymerase-3 subunit delta